MGFLIFLLVLACLGILAVIYLQICGNYVKKNSLAASVIKETNQKYVFFPNESYQLEHTYDNPNFYDTVSPEDFLIYHLQYTSSKVKKCIANAEENKIKLQAYEQEIGEQVKFNSFETIPKYMFPSLLKKYEINYCNKLIQHPSTKFVITVYLYWQKMNGYTQTCKADEFSSEQILVLIKRTQNRNGNFFNDRGIWDAICRVERGKVSNRLRFQVYERDGYRCCKCKRSQAFADLEIDHIIPISKGGKTTFDNLQTLCHECNVAKGDSMPYNR